MLGEQVLSLKAMRALPGRWLETCSRAPLISTSSVCRENTLFETLHLFDALSEMNAAPAAPVIGSTDPSVYRVMSCLSVRGVR